jgi:hypothetical protein
MKPQPTIANALESLSALEEALLAAVIVQDKDEFGGS